MFIIRDFTRMFLCVSNNTHDISQYAIRIKWQNQNINNILKKMFQWYKSLSKLFMKKSQKKIILWFSYDISYLRNSYFYMPSSYHQIIKFVIFNLTNFNVKTLIRHSIFLFENSSKQLIHKNCIKLLVIMFLETFFLLSVEIIWAFYKVYSMFAQIFSHTSSSQFIFHKRVW